MDREGLRRLKHDLRTPVNHIVGYSALISELASEERDLEVVSQTARVQAIAKSMNLDIEALVSLIDDRAHIDRYRESIQKVCSAILLTKETLRGGRDLLEDANYRDDLLRVRAALERLEQFITLLPPCGETYPASPAVSGTLGSLSVVRCLAFKPVLRLRTAALCEVSQD